MKTFASQINKILLVLILCSGTSACIGTVVGAVVDTTIEVVKVPFKVGAAVIDVATDDDFTDLGSDSDTVHKDLSTDAAAVKMENSQIR